MDEPLCQSLFKPIMMSDTNSPPTSAQALLQANEQHTEVLFSDGGPSTSTFDFAGLTGVSATGQPDDDYDYSSLYFEAIDLCMPLVNDLGAAAAATVNAAFPTYNSNSQDGQVLRPIQFLTLTKRILMFFVCFFFIEIINSLFL